ncbi:hypothetical protein P4O66_017603, partial [Electrophorus voltai]
KPKVYQGVRVKTTVKELLQKRRALQAAELRTSRSPPPSFSLPSPVDYNSYSSPDSHSSSSSCYSSPTRMDMSSSFGPEHNHYQHCSFQHCLCLSDWPSLQDGVPASEHASYGASDCFYSSFGEDTYCRRDSSSSELCYL